MASVSIRPAHEKTAAVSNEKGVFAVSLKQIPDTLMFSAVGFDTYSVVITGKTLADPAFEVVLLRLSSPLSEVVVTGYSTAKRKDLTGSVATLSDGVLAGRAAGVLASPAGSARIRLRGSRSYDKETVSINPAYSTRLITTDSAVVTDDPEDKARRLTAGELNDFAKWKMWEDFSGHDFKDLSDHWRLYATHRYCVQLHNEQFAAVVGREVYLLNARTKDTVWKAVTDVSGKAELWAGLGREQQEAAHYRIACQGSSAFIDEPAEFANGINNMTLDAPCHESNTVDIAFMVDATGSMGDEIEYLKHELEDILQRTFAKYNDLDVNAAAVFYRDHEDDYVTKYTGFNNNLLKTLNFIKLQNAGGGGDMPEAVNTALHTALDSLNWNPVARARLLFLVLDAPPHDEVRDDMLSLITKAAAKGIRIVPIVCSGADKSTEFIMRTLTLATNGSYIFLTDESGIGNAHLKPTTDAYTVELLSSLLQRLIQQMVYIQPCHSNDRTEPVTKASDNILHLKITPNPTTGNLYISSNKKLAEMYVTDFTGKILMKLNPQQSNLQLSLREYPDGTYFIRYSTEDKQWGAEKVILIH